MLTVTVQPSGHNLLLGFVQRASDFPFHAFRRRIQILNPDKLKRKCVRRRGRGEWATGGRCAATISLLGLQQQLVPT